METRRPQIKSFVSLFAFLITVLLILPGYSYGACADSWASIHNSGTVNFDGVAANGNTIVLAGDGGIIDYSTDGGSNWSSVDKGSMTFTDVVYDNGIFVAVGTSGNIYTSTNGSTWTSRTSGTSEHLQGICYTGSKFVAVGSQVSTVSNDGITWSATTQTSKYFQHVCYNSGTLIAAGPAGKVYRSTNEGSSWTIITSGLSTSNLKGVAYGNNRWVVAASDSNVYYSTNNGTNWTLAATTGQTCYDAVYAYDTFVISTYKASNKNMLVSTDGVNWTSKLAGSGNFRGVGWTGSHAILVGPSSVAYESDCGGCTKTKGAITDPTSGTLPGPNDIFYWSAGSCLAATPYRLTIGSSAYGGTDVYDSGWTTSTSKTVTTLTTDGGTAYVRLQTKYSDDSTENDDKSLTFAAKASVSSPSTSSALTGATVTFSRNSATGTLAASPYKLIVGSSSGGNQYHDSGWSTASSFTVNNLPTNGSSVYVRLYTKYATNETPYKDYVYTAANFVKATLTAPTQGETLTSSVKTITWNAGTGVRTTSPKYRVLLGSSAGASDISNLTSDSTSVQATGLPTNGSTIHVTLYTYFTDDSSQTDAKSCTAVTYTVASVSSPSNGSTLTSKTVTFSWSGAAGVRTSSPKYRLLLGTTAGASDISNLTSDTTSAQASNLPSNGSTIYAKLITYFTDDSSNYNSTSYTAVTFTAASVSSPANSSTLTSKTVTFSWSGGVGVRTTNPKYRLLLGTTAGASDINNITSDTASVQASNLPSNGSTIHATLVTYFTDDSSSSNTSSYTAVTFTAAAISTPTNGSTLTSSIVTFEWSGAVGERTTSPKYRLLLGTTAGASDINNVTSDGNNVEVTGLPLNGSTVYAKLITYFTDDSSSDSQSSYTSCTKAAATVSDPTQGSTLEGPSDTFYWTAGSCLDSVNPYYLKISRVSIGGTDVYDSGWIAHTSKKVSSLYVGDVNCYVRITTKYSDGTTANQDYVYREAKAATITSPTNGSTLSGISVTFTSSTATGVLDASPYRLLVGTTAAGSSDVNVIGWSTASSFTVGNIPTAGEQIYVRLETKYLDGSTVRVRDYTYTAATFTAASITSPADGCNISNSTTTFSWSGGGGVRTTSPKYRLLLGTTVGASDINNVTSDSTSVQVSNLQLDGDPIYTTLITYFTDNSSKSTQTWYTTTCTKTAAAINDPTAGTTLPGPTDTFYWTAGSCVAATPYRLMIGYSGVGSTDKLDTGWISDTSKVASNLNTVGAITYVRLMTKYSDDTTANQDYTYTSAYKAAITSPANGSTLPGATATFTRDNATGTLDASPYRLIISSSVIGGTDVYDSGWSTASSFTATSIPTNGGYAYSRLQTKYATGEERNRDYTFICAIQTYTKATMASPAPEWPLLGSKVTFNWNAGGGLAASNPYRLRIGTTAGGTDIYNGSWISSTSALVTTLPTDGDDVYTTLTTKFSDNSEQNESLTYYTHCATCQSGSCGDTWQSSYTPDNNQVLFDVAYGNGKYVTAGNPMQIGSSFYPQIYSSTNGINWTLRTSPYTGSKAAYFKIATNGTGTFVACMSEARIIRSTDGGTTWASVYDNPNLTFTKGTTTYIADFVGIAYGNGRFVAVGEAGYVVYSTSGASGSWTQIRPTTSSLRNCEYCNDRFMTGTAAGVIYFSTNGSSWSSTSVPDGNSLTYFAYKNGVYITGSRHMYRSTNGINWTKVADLQDDFGYSTASLLYHGCTVNSGTLDFVLVGDPSIILKSSDLGLTYTKQTPFAGSYLLGVTADGGDKIITCGSAKPTSPNTGHRKNLYYATCQAGDPEITSPKFGSNIDTSTVSFYWTNGGQSVVDYEFSLGTTPYAADISYYHGTGTSKQVSGIPVGNGNLYATLSAKVGTVWTDYLHTYSTFKLAEMNQPANGATFTSNSVTFNWFAGDSRATAYELDLGSTPGQWDIGYQQVTPPTTSCTINNIPADGRTIYATLYTVIDGRIDLRKSYTYTAYNETGNEPNYPEEYIPDEGSVIGSVTSKQLEVKVKDPQNDNMNVTFYGRQVDDSCDFKIVVIGDIQWLSADRPDVLNDVMDRIIAINPKAVVHVGDHVQDDSNEQQWDNAKAGFDKLKAANIPYLNVMGNHDRLSTNDPRSDSSDFRAHFPLSDFTSKSWWGGYYSSDEDSRWIKFAAGGFNWGIISSEYSGLTSGYDTASTGWVLDTVTTESSRRFIFATHGLLTGFSGDPIPGLWCPKGSPGDGNGIYTAIKSKTNIDFALSGHRIGTVVRSDTYNGHTLHSMLFNTQDNYPVPYPNHLPNEGWIRILTFSPKTNQVHAKTYKTVPEKYDWRAFTAFMPDHDTRSAYTLSYTMLGNPPSWTTIGTDSGVTSGDYATINWSNLQSNKTYEWYVRVSDGTNYIDGPIIRFETGATDLATIISPPDGAQLSNSAVTFTWNKSTDAAATNYWVDVGTYEGGWDINDSGQLGSNVTTWTCYNVPINGSNVYVTLSTKVSGAWYGNDYVYTTLASAPAEMTSPSGRTNLTSSTTSFNWSTGAGVTEYNLQVGTAANATAYHNYTTTTGTTRDVTGLPTDGSTVYVKLRSKISGVYQENNYTYTALKNAPAGSSHSYLTAGGKVMVYHNTSDEHLYFDCSSNEVAYTMQIIKESSSKYYTIFHSEPNKPNAIENHWCGDGIKLAIRSGSFNYTIPSTRTRPIWRANDTYAGSRIWSSDAIADYTAEKTWRTWGGPGNPMVVKGPSDSYYYVHFIAAADTDGDRHLTTYDEGDFSHFLGLARTTNFSSFEMRTEIESEGGVCWKTYGVHPELGWDYPRCLDDSTGAQLTCLKTNYHMHETNGMLGSICYYDGKYYFFYCDDIDPYNSSHWHLYYRWTNDVDELTAATSWSPAIQISPKTMGFGQLVKIAPAHDMDKWAVIYHATQAGSTVPDICVQYTQNMDVVGTGGISDISYNDASGKDSRYLGRAIGDLSAGATCYQHYFMTDPTGRLAVPDDKTQNATSGGLVTFTDHGPSFQYVWGGEVYCMGWNLYVPQATVPSPANAQTGVSTSTNISWNAGYKATSYNVYFGTASTPPYIGNQVSTTYDPTPTGGTLQASKTYYWRVDAINGDDDTVTTGKVWSFTTQ